MLNKKYIVSGLIAFLAGEALIVAAIILPKAEIGSLADWVSGIGAIGAIVGVIYQVHEQRTEFQQSKNADIAIALGIVKILKEDKSKSMMFPSDVAQTYCYNIGYSAGSFRFLGFATKETVKNLKDNKPETEEKRIKDPERENHYVTEVRKFYRIDSRETSNYINYDLGLLKQNFNDGDKIYAVYDDPLGKLYFSIDFIIIRKD